MLTARGIIVNSEDSILFRSSSDKHIITMLAEKESDETIKRLNLKSYVPHNFAIDMNTHRELARNIASLEFPLQT